MKNQLRQFLLLAAMLPVVIVLSNCAGYQMGSVKPSEYKDINRIYIPAFENKTLEPRASAIVTNAVIKQIQADGTFAVSTKESADAVLEGKISRIERRQLRAVRTDTLRSSELMLYIVVEWSLRDPQTGEKLAYSQSRNLDDTNRDSISSLRHRPGRVIGRTIQFLDPNFQLSERNAIPLAAEDAAKVLVSQLAEGW
ncbi:MAG: hypothetical protein HKN23_08895 [Verrucomicrobiales bacterium]|nr:hypothetical protein [Verrucomicrobiales bacterium]